MARIPAIIPSKDVALPPDVVEHARRIVDAGTAPNTRRAYQGDLRYFWAWAEVAGGVEQPAYPVSVALVVRFITDHLGGLAAERDHELVTLGIKAGLGPQRLTTIRRRLAALSTVHEAKGMENPCHESRVRKLLSKAARAEAKDGKTVRKKRAATRDVLDAMLATCGDTLIDVRDRALLLVGAGSGGRRRSELASMRIEDVTEVPGGYLIRLTRTKTDQEGRGQHVPVLGRGADALRHWLNASGVTAGPLFRGVAKGGRLTVGLNDRTVARIVQKRAGLAGFDPAEFGGHSLRSGFVTESGRQGVPLGDTKALSGHRSDAVAMGYYQSGAVLQNPAARVFG